MSERVKKETIDAVLENLRHGNGIQKSCTLAGITHVTFWRTRKTDPELETEYQQILDSRTQIVEDALFKNACGYKKNDGTEVPPNTTAQIFWLKNRAGDRWRDVQDYRHEGNVGMTIHTPEQACTIINNLIPDYAKTDEKSEGDKEKTE